MPARDFSPEELAEVEAILAREEKATTKIISDTMERLTTVSMISRKQAVISILVGWLASESQGDEDLAFDLLSAIYNETPDFLRDYCAAFRQEAAKFAASHGH